MHLIAQQKREKISELEGRTTEITQSEQRKQTENRASRNCKSLNKRDSFIASQKETVKWES